MSNLKYNYVMFGNPADFIRISHGDLNKVDYAKYLIRRIDTDNKLLTKLYQIHTSPKTNKLFKLPGQKFWNRFAFKGKFNDDKPICFIFNPGSKWVKNGLIEYLRKTYPDCKIAFICADLVKYICKGMDYHKLRPVADVAVSFDHKDCEEYGMINYPLLYSPYDFEKNTDISESDVYFVGKAKDRLDDIISAYEKLRDAGLKCDFYITGVRKEDQKYPDEITYGSQMSYVENLNHIRQTKALLEIMQQGGHGYTLRTCEAIMYDKKMITNNPEIKNASFYSPERISVFEDVSEIDADFVLREPQKVDYQFKDKLSPLKFLEFLDEKFA